MIYCILWRYADAPPPFDTHTTVKQFLAAGFSEEQAEILVETIVSHFSAASGNDETFPEVRQKG